MHSNTASIFPPILPAFASASRHPGAGVEGFGFEDELAVLVGDAMAEVQPHALDERRPDFIASKSS